MKTPYIKSLALIGVLTCSLTASAEKSYMQVPSTNWLKNGSQYVFGLVSAGSSVTGNAWVGKTPLVYTANDENTAFSMVSVPTEEFTDNMIWTVLIDENSDFHCGNSNHSASNKVIKITRGDKALGYNASNGATYNNKSLYDVNETTTAYTPIEVVEVNAEQYSMSADDHLTVWHVAPSPSNHTLFQKMHSVNHNGDQGYGSTSTTSTACPVFNGLKVNGNGDANSYTSLTRTYLVIDSENLATAAATIWEGMTEDDIAANAYTQQHINLLRERQVPDVTECTNATLYTFLQEKYAEPLEGEKPYVAQDFDGKILQFHHTLTINNQTVERYMAHNGSSLSSMVSPLISSRVWFAEYDAEQDGIILSFDGKYAGAVPNNVGNNFSLTENRDEAGVYRFFTHTDANGALVAYSLTCTKTANGTALTQWEFGGYDDPTTNVWMTDNGSGSLQRWGSNPDGSKWQISVIDNEDAAITAAATEALKATFPNINPTLSAATAARVIAQLTATTFPEKLSQAETIAAQAFTATPEAGKFYRIKSALNYDSGIKAIKFNNNNMRWESISDTDNTFIWSFTPAENGTYALRSAVDGRYPATITANGNYTLQAAATAVTIEVINANDKQVLIKNNRSFHCLGHGGGSGSNGNLMGYNTNGDLNTASAWYLEPLTESETEALLEHYRSSGITEGAPEWVESLYAAQLDIINSESATTSEKIDAYLAMQTITPEGQFEGKLIKIQSYARQTYYACVGNTANGNRIKMSTLGEDHSDFLFFYTADHKLVHPLTGRAMSDQLEINAIESADAYTITYSSIENAYKLHTTASKWAHDNSNNPSFGSILDRCSNDASDHNNTHSFYLVAATDEEVAQLLGHVEEPSIEGTGFTEGNNTGELVVKADWDWSTYKNNLGITAENFTLEAYAAVSDFNTMAPHKYSMAPVATGRYYRIKASAKNLAHNNIPTEERYLSDANTDNNRAKFATAAENNTIFYYSPEQHLLSANSGRYLTKNSFAYNHYAALTSSMTTPQSLGATVYPFVGSATELGTYELKLNDSNRSVHLSATTDGGEANACDDHGATDYAHNFVLEEVTELPISIQAQGYGSFIAPVPAVIEGATGVYAEVITDSESRAFQLQPMADGAVIPANTPVFVMGGAGETATATLRYSSAEAPAAVRSRAAEESEANGIINIHASHVAQGITTAEGMKAFALCPATTESEKDNANDIHFAEITDGIQPANTVCITVDANHEIVSGSKAVMSIEKEYTTEIREISAAGSAAEVIYDLQGRRLTKPVHGINIINGHKVYVK